LRIILFAPFDKNKPTQLFSTAQILSLSHKVLLLGSPRAKNDNSWFSCSPCTHGV
jgi:hypothetical protein